MICYRWAAGPRHYEEMSSWVVLALEAALQKVGQQPWWDKRHLLRTSQDLVQTVGQEMERRKMVIICLGPNDLQRCQQEGDFFRWEIDNATQLEADGKLKVVIAVYGIETTEALVNRAKKLGEWGKTFSDYLTKHYLIFLKVSSLDKEVSSIIDSLN